MSQPEFSRPVRLDTLGDRPRAVSVAAEPEECAALARRFGLETLDRLEAEVSLRLAGEEVRLEGRLRAEAVQACVASGEPIPAALDLPFALLFRPPPPPTGADEEVELGESELDVVFHDGATVDVGEAVAETLALNLDPYPRAPDADAALRAAGVKSEAEAGPFAALAGLREKLAERSHPGEGRDP